MATAARCPTGVAKVETQLSFVNMLVGFLTLSIYTPMDIRVTCAEGGVSGTALFVPDSASVATWSPMIVRAAEQSRAEGRPVYLQATR